ncbi:MGMT family protein [Peribacillus glennii]|uniref:DNA methyltransferase n=1 Tax=Peribacillus glennii TaxID=2303991 RepID=A0A372LB36_9BACI|nr:MGMT family protein [Peribacillus glennii]RFU62531.1 DNA methyltransferase [Peribacillus glennii]
MKPFTARAIEIIQSVPEGKVMTYGQVARLAGSPRGARQVVRILHSMSDNYKLPWHRIINSKGQIVIKDDESNSLQKLLLEEEGVEVKGDGIDLALYQYHPDSFYMDENPDYLI